MKSAPAGAGSISVNCRASVLLPQPDSPTTAGVRPAGNEKLTPFSALTTAGGLNRPRPTR